jgi:outer membrane protein with beta-barrel domain
MKKIFPLLLFIFCAPQLFAQHGSSFGLTYSISFPMGDLHDYTTKTSFRGFEMEYNYHIQPHISLGVETGWNTFYERVEKKTYTDGTASITGVQYRYTNAVPILATGRYIKTGSGKAEPFVGLGIGTLYVDRATDFGLYRISSDAWQFCVRPELGVILKSGRGVAGLISAKYYYAFDTDNLSGQPYLSLNIGLLWGE